MHVFSKSLISKLKLAYCQWLPMRKLLKSYSPEREMHQGQENRYKAYKGYDFSKRYYHILWRFLDLLHMHSEQEQSHSSKEQKHSRGSNPTALGVHFVSKAYSLMGMWADLNAAPCTACLFSAMTVTLDSLAWVFQQHHSTRITVTW